MPETFGAGVSGSSYDPRMIPFPTVSHHLVSGDIWTWTPTENNLWIVNAVDLTTDGGGGSGFVAMDRGSTSSTVCIFNVGTSSDAFSWRGMLALPYSGSGVLRFTAVSGQGVAVHISGYACSYLAF